MKGSTASMNVPDLITNYGYPMVFLGAILEGEAVVLLAGLAAHQGYLDLGGVIAAAFLGGFFSDQMYFGLGRHFGTHLKDRFAKFKQGAARFSGILERHPLTIIPAVRFLYGMRTFGPFAIGMTTVPWPTFGILDLGGTVVWAGTLGLLGYAFGHELQAVFGDLKKYEGYIFAGLALIGLTLALIVRIRNARIDQPSVHE